MASKLLEHWRIASAGNAVVALLFQPVREKAVALPRVVMRRDVIDWAPEKRQRVDCLFRRQTPEPKNTEMLCLARWGDNSCCEAQARYQPLCRINRESTAESGVPPLSI
jgi:hypothetical protein